jgi:trimeric autotransporter adhesin
MKLFSLRAIPQLAGLLLAAYVATTASAQTNYGAVRGLVSDPQGAIVIDASVSLTNEQTHVSRSSVTNKAGEYLFTAVDPGTYTISITATGFQKQEQKEIAVGIGATQTIDVSLKTGEVTQEIVVAGGGAPLIDTASASEGLTLDSQKLQDLPNLGRNPFVFDKLDNNVTPTGDPRFVRAEDQSGTTSVSVAGAPIGSTGGANAANNYVVDGIPVSTSAGGATFIPSLEAIADSKVEADTYDAEVGRSGGGVFNTTLKSGSATYHGTLYGETRQTNWVANTWQNNLNNIARPDSTTYLYAGAFGGPVPLSNKINLLKNTFFWVSEEGYRQAQPYTGSTTQLYVPTAAERSGDFSADTAYPLYDPTTRKTFISEYGSNKVPSNFINPIGQYIANQYPACTTCAIYGAASYNFAGSDDFKTRSDMYSGKVDHVFTNWWSASASYVHLATQEPNGNVEHVFAESDGVIHRFNDATAVNNVFTLGPTLVLTVGYGFNRYYSDTLQYSSGFDQTSGFGGAGFPAGLVSQLQSNTFPTISLSGVTNAAGLGAATSGPTVNASKNVVVGIVKSLHNHTLKAGYVFRSMNESVSSASGGNGSYTFNGIFSDPSGKTLSSSVYPLADLLMGLPSTASATINAVGLVMNEKYDALYVQDDVRITPKLTVNAGIRYEYELGQTEASNRYNVGFDPNISYTFPSAAAPTAKGGLAFAGVGKYPIHCCDESHTKFNPRIGVAFELRKGTVIRGGAGVFYAGVSLTPYSTGYSQTTTLTTTSFPSGSALSNTQIGANADLSNPFGSSSTSSGLLAPTGNTLGALSGVGGSVTAQAFGRRFPLVDQYSVDVEQQLPAGFVLKLGYVGAHARNWGQPVGIDQLPDSVMASYAAGGANVGTNLSNNASGTNPFYTPSITVSGSAYPTTGVVAKTAVTLAQLLLPYPQFQGTTSASSDTGVMLIESNGKSLYNALDVKVQKQMSYGLTVLATYTWSSSWDNIYATTSTLESSTAGMQDNYNIGAEYARSINDMPNRATAAITYKVPVGRGQQYFANMNRWLDYGVGGWQINDEWIDQNGSPLAITQSNLNDSGTYGTPGVGGATQRPNLVAGVNPCKSGSPESRSTAANPYFNLNAFTPAMPYSYGNTPRTIACKGPGYVNSDISLFKDFKIWEGINIQARVEALNAFNTPELGSPSTTLVPNSGYSPTGYTSGTPGFGTASGTGVISSSLGFGRIIQIGGRISF